MNMLRSARAPFLLVALLLTAAGVFWTAPVAAQQDLFTVTPCRVAETRDLLPGGERNPDTNTGTPLVHDTPQSFQVAGVCGIPSTAKGVVVMLAAVNSTNNGNIVIYEDGTATPNTSSVNFRAGENRASNTFVALSASGKIAALARLNGAGNKVHFVVDVTGYFLDAPPAVASTTPANNASGVALDADIIINFSENVNVASDAFVLECPAGTPVPFTLTPAAPGGTNSFTLNPDADLTLGVSCTVTVTASKVADVDGDDPPDTMEANYVFSFSTLDAAPSVVSTTPTDGATSVDVQSNITIDFSENVNVTASAFTLECPAASPVAFTLTPAPPGGTNSFTLDPTGDLPDGVVCTVTVVAAQVTDTDTDDPPNTMAADYTFTFTPEAQPPVVTTTAGSTSFSEGGGPVVVDSGVTVTDADSANLVSATVTITNPQDGAAEVLAATSCAGLTVTPGLNSLSITGSQPPATYQTCLQSVTYNNTSPNPDTTARVISFVANDGLSSSTPATKTVTMGAVDNAPVVTTTVGTTAFTEDGGAVVVDSGVTVTDADSANLASATVTITNPQDGAAEVLAATSCAGLTVTPGLNTLSITGSQPKATYQTCLQSVTYNNTSQNPGTTARVISFVANDGTSSSTPATKTVTMAAQNDAPVVTTTVGTTAFTEDGGAVVVDSGLTVIDDDNANLASATVTITNPQDGAAEVLAATSCAGLTLTPGLNSLSITGSQPVATYQTCLRSVTYNNTSNNPGTTPRVISFVANDGTDSSTPATKTVTAAAAPDAPVVTTTAGTTSFTEDAGAVVVDSGVTVTDVDSTNLASATVTITNPQDGAAEVLAATSCAGLTVTPGLNTLSITGSQPLATYQTCLQSVTYNNTSNNPGTTARVISFVANDGAASSSPATKTVTVAATPDAPVVTTTVGATAFTEDGGAVVVDSGLTVTDADSTNLASATVTITNPQDGASEVLAATSCAGLTVTPGLNTVSITGSQPVATYQICLRSVTYNNTSQNPDTTARVISFVANDGAASSTPATKTVSVAANPDAPVVTTTVGTTGFTEDGGAVTVDSGVLVSDVDSTNLASATVTITNPQDGASEVLGATSCAGLTVTPGLNTLSITGSQPVATYQTCLQSVTYNNSSQNPGTTARVISFVVNDGASSSTPATKTVTVTAVNDQPTITAIANQTIDEDTSTGALAFTIGDAETAAASLTLGATSSDGTIIPNGNIVFGGSGASRTVTVTPAANKFGGPVTITITVNDGSGQPNSTNTSVFTVTVNSVPDPPVPGVDSWTTIGNTELRVNRGAVSRPFLEDLLPANGVLANDTDPIELTAITLVGIPSCDTSGPTFGPCATTNGGTVTLEADGTFSYVPAAGSTTADSFQYTIQNALGASANGTVNLTISNMVWYIDPDAPAGGNGTSTQPFNSLTATNVAGAAGAGDLDGAGHYIYVDDGTLSTTQTLELEANQHLIGEGEALSFALALNGNASAPLANAATEPQLTNTAGNAINITAAIPAEIIGLSLQGTGNAIDLTSGAALTGSPTLTIGNNTFRGATAEGIDINLNVSTTGTLGLNITGNSWDAAGTHTGNAVDINRAAGTLNLNFSGNTNIVSNATAVLINGGAVANTTITGFSGNSVHGNSVGGIQISQATFDSNLVTGGFQQVNGGNLPIGALGNGVNSSGMALTSVQGNLFFDDLDIYSTATTSGTGLQISGTGGGMTFSVTPASPDGIGTSSIDSDNGPALDVTSATIDLRLEKLESNTTGSGLSLNTVAGQLLAPTGSSITKTSGGGTAFSVASSSATVSYGGTLNVTSGAGVSLTSNTGVMSFSGGMTLSTGANAGFSATGGGTVTVTDPAGPTNNTITTTTGTALNVASTTIGASGLTFERISAGTSGSPANGIVLSSTGSGALTVTGTGSAGSGGTINSATGPGISLTNTGTINLSYMNVQNGGDDGIRGSGVNGLNLTSLSVSSNGNAVGEHGVEVAGLTGSGSMANCTVTGSAEHNVSIANTSGTLSAFNVTNSSFTNTNMTTGGDGFLVENNGSGSMSVSITGSTFTDNKGDHFQASTFASTTGSIALTFSNNTLTTTAANDPNVVGGGITISPTGSADVTFTINNNNIQQAFDEAININLGGASTAASSLTGTISTNTIGTAGDVDSGSESGSGINVASNGAGLVTVAVTNNQIRQYANPYGIVLAIRDGSTSMNATVTGNTVANPGSFAINGIRVDAGATAGDSGTLCAAVSGNSAAGSGPGVDTDIRLRQRFNTTIRLPGYGGSNSDTTAVNSFVAGNNAGSDVSSAHNVGGGGGGFVGGAACPTP